MTIMNDITFSSIEANIGLKNAIGKSPQDIISSICDSGIKGRGGAGFPTGLKWKFASEATADKKYVICNADEGEPGTFKDRVILTEWPDLVIEGMTIAALAIGAKEGFLYLREEYSYLAENLKACIQKRYDENLLGKNILNKMEFDLHLRFGSGAYICGEETALIESIEGHRGESRNRPPFPVTNGYKGYPTVINNVETLAWIATIMNKGASWFKSFGTEKSIGMKLFSVSGDIKKPGVYEFPWGISINDLLKEVDGENAKAIVCGAAGSCIPASQFNRTFSYEDVATGGSVIVFGSQRDMLNVAENFLEFFEEESCGQCNPCRLGNTKLLEGIRLLKKGECSTKYIKDLCKLGETMQLTSKCGLGQSSPNAFLSVINYFKDEILGRMKTSHSDV